MYSFAAPEEAKDRALSGLACRYRQEESLGDSGVENQGEAAAQDAPTARQEAPRAQPRARDDPEAIRDAAGSQNACKREVSLKLMVWKMITGS